MIHEDRLRFGVLGAAKIAPDALIKPAAASDRARVVAIAARDPERARGFAEEHGIEQIDGRTTYDHQLEAFVAAVLDGEEQPTGGRDGVANMRVIDAVYRAAGMQPRG
jgi:predicted dehydrogenase